MAWPQPGVIEVTLEFGENLRDVEWLGREDPYAEVRVGSQAYRTQTAHNAGRNPVWNETFRFDAIDEYEAVVEIKDQNLIRRNGHIGTAVIPFTSARERGADRQMVPVICSHTGRQHGIISVSLQFTPAGGYNAYPAYAAAEVPPPAPVEEPRHHHHHHHHRPEVVEEVVVVEEPRRIHRREEEVVVFEEPRRFDRRAEEEVVVFEEPRRFDRRAEEEVVVVEEPRRFDRGEEEVVVVEEPRHRLFEHERRW